MARTNNLTNFLTDVATAIKTKKGSETAIPAANFDTEITNLPSQGTYQIKSLSVTQNGSQTVTPDSGYDAMTSVTVTTNVTDTEYATNLALSEEILDKPYIELQYIQSTGTQWINTGIYGKKTTNIDMKFRQTSTTTYSGIFGGRTAYYSNGFTYFNTDVGASNKKLFQMADTQSGVTLSSNVSPYYLNVDTTLTINNGYLTLDDGTHVSHHTHTAASTSFTTVYPIYLFGVNDHGSIGDSNNYSLRVYYFKIYDGETLVCHLIPVKRKSDNAICMYDKVSCTFFENQGTGNFTAGPVIS